MPAMNLSQFRNSLANPKPPPGLAPALTALWWAAKDKWEKAHNIVMDEGGKDCAWVHAYLHRVEGDLENAAAAAGAVMNLTSALAASASFAPAMMPLENVVNCWMSAGNGPT